MAFLVEEDERGQRAFESLQVKDPKLFNILSSGLAQKIVRLLAEQPMCAMDVARKLKQHEQKIYYHLRNLERIGVIKLLKTEERVGATAKIYAVNSPVVHYKLFDSEEIVDRKTKVKEIKFFGDFIIDGKLNATIVTGSPDPHGKYSSVGSDGSCAIDLGLFLGSLVMKSELPNYKLDTEVNEKDLKGNLILVGGPKANIIVEKVNKKLPVYFDPSHEWDIVSPFSKNIYSQEGNGIVAKIKNPFNPSKQVLVLAGKRFKGTRSAILALVKHLKEIEKGNHFDSDLIAKVVQGVDIDSDGRIDDVEFLE